MFTAVFNFDWKVRVHIKYSFNAILPVFGIVLDNSNLPLWLVNMTSLHMWDGRCCLICFITINRKLTLENNYIVILVNKNGMSEKLFAEHVS